MKLKDASFLIRIYSFLMSNNKIRSMINIFMTFNYFYLTWLIELTGNNTIGNIQVCYAAVLPVSIVELERS
jgi:hypothetical protein